MERTHSTTAALVAATLLVTASVVFAQQPKMGMGDMPMSPGMMGTMHDCPMMGMAMGSDTTIPVADRITSLRTELGITDAQKTAWDAYAATLTTNLQGMQAMRQTMMKVMEAKTPVERLDARVSAMDVHLASMKALKPTLTALYAALSDQQKTKASQILAGKGCMM